MNPIWYVFGTLVAVSTVLGAYAVGRDRFDEPAFPTESSRTDPPEDDSERNADERNRSSTSNGLAMLPDDEKRIVEPIFESPGLMQVELRGRSDFSKAKVSQTVSDLEDHGLIYREKQGRTYCVYPGELLEDRACGRR
jgi:uncharacterized membrane protein